MINKPIQVEAAKHGGISIRRALNPEPSSNSIPHVHPVPLHPAFAQADFEKITAKRSPTEEEYLLYQQITAQEDQISNDVQAAVAKCGGQMAGFKNRLKTISSVVEKLDKLSSLHMNIPMEKLNDLIRYTAIFPPDLMVSQGQKVLQELCGMGYTLTRVVNSWNNSLTPYKGVNTYLISPTGQPFELQFHTADSFRVKNGKQHELYVESRKYSIDSPEAKRRMREMANLSANLERPAGIESWN